MYTLTVDLNEPWRCVYALKFHVFFCKTCKAYINAAEFPIKAAGIIVLFFVRRLNTLEIVIKNLPIWTMYQFTGVQNKSKLTLCCNKS